MGGGWSVCINDLPACRSDRQEVGRQVRGIIGGRLLTHAGQEKSFADIRLRPIADLASSAGHTGRRAADMDLRQDRRDGSGRQHRLVGPAPLLRWRAVLRVLQRHLDGRPESDAAACAAQVARRTLESRLDLNGTALMVRCSIIPYTGLGLTRSGSAQLPRHWRPGRGRQPAMVHGPILVRPAQRRAGSAAAAVKSMTQGAASIRLAARSCTGDFDAARFGDRFRYAPCMTASGPTRRGRAWRRCRSGW
jgi:hypothetical protein